jgi:transcriptional regulator with XRE-family HTH domain
LTLLRDLRTLTGVTHKRFAAVLFGWRKENAYTQQEAADRLGVSRRSLENWEQERAMPQGFGLSAMLKLIQAPKKKR